MDLEIGVIILLSIGFFVAGFIDSIAGGGGLITLPALLFAGIPPQLALGTNKLISSLGTGTAVLNFMLNKKMLLKVLAIGIIFSISGSFVGSKTILLLDTDLVGKIIIILLPIGIIATLIPRKGKTNNNKLTNLDYWLKIPVICLTIGFYDGFFGPGTGSFLTLGFFFFTRMKLVQATANAKVFNLMSNLGSLVAFLLAGKVLFIISIPLALANMTGNYFGSRLAIKKGEGIIRIFLIIAFVLLLSSLIWKYYF